MSSSAGSRLSKLIESILQQIAAIPNDYTDNDQGSNGYRAVEVVKNHSTNPAA